MADLETMIDELERDGWHIRALADAVLGKGECVLWLRTPMFPDWSATATGAHDELQNQGLARDFWPRGADLAITRRGADPYQPRDRLWRHRPDGLDLRAGAEGQ
jgi:hypothetical protein